MPGVDEIVTFLAQLAPPVLAEQWDNVGLLVGDRNSDVSAVITCLTLTPDVAAEAIQQGAHLVVTHHPVLFQPIQKLTGDDAEGRMLLDLVAAGVAVYSPHTGYDSAVDGINRQLAELLDLHDVGILRPSEANSTTSAVVRAGGSPTNSSDAIGAGRFGRLQSAISLGQFNELVKQKLHVSYLQFVGDPAAGIERVAIACGSAAEFVNDAIRCKCDVLLTGEARFHACLEARTKKLALVLPGHYATERPAMERLATLLANHFPGLTVWPSRQESDPIRWS